MNPKKYKQLKHRYKMQQKQNKRTAEQIAQTVPSLLANIDNHLNHLLNAIITLNRLEVHDPIPDIPDIHDLSMPDAPKLKQRYAIRIPDIQLIQIPDKPKLAQRKSINIPDISKLTLPDVPELPQIESLPDINELNSIDVPEPVSVSEMTRELSIIDDVDLSDLPKPKGEILTLVRNAQYELHEGVVDQIVFNTEFYVEEQQYTTAVIIAQNAIENEVEQSAGHGYAKILDRMGLDARIVATYVIGSEYYKMEQMYVQRQPSTRHSDTGTWIMKQAQFGISNRAKAEMQSIRDVYYQQAHDQELKSL